LHPLAELAVELHGLLNGGPAGLEVYRLKRYEIPEDVFEFVVAPCMSIMAATVSEVEAEKREADLRRANDRFPEGH